MATINQHISNLRGLIKEHDRNPDVYSNSFLYELLNSARTTLIEQDINKLDAISQWDWLQFPMKLIPDKSHLIGCVKVGCDILRTEYKVPRPITSNIQSMIRFTSFDYTDFIFGTEQDWENAKFDDIKSKNNFISIINGYAVLWNNKNIKYILVNSIPENPLDWASIPQCDNNGVYTVNPCYDFLNSQYPLSEVMKNTAYDMVLKKLQLPLQLKSDFTNDSNSEIRN